ncbi:hypothetical protein J6590_080709 [Homalodisca vitripennis]|nr:hypothetical protein J6590_080709 [Homalodisca vitripennis]
MENTIVQTRPKNNGRLRSNGLKCEAMAVTALATSRRRESYVSDGACHLEGRVTGSIVLVQLEDVFYFRADERDLVFQSFEHLQVKGCDNSFSIRCKLKMDDSKNYHHHYFLQDLLMLPFFGFGRRFCVPFEALPFRFWIVLEQPKFVPGYKKG